MTNLNWHKGLKAWNKVFKFFEKDEDLIQLIKAGNLPKNENRDAAKGKHLQFNVEVFLTSHAAKQFRLTVNLKRDSTKNC